MSLLEKGLGEGAAITGLRSGMRGGGVRPQRVGGTGLARQGRGPGLSPQDSRSCGRVVSMEGVYDPLALKGPVENPVH